MPVLLPSIVNLETLLWGQCRPADLPDPSTLFSSDSEDEAVSKPTPVARPEPRAPAPAPKPRPPTVTAPAQQPPQAPPTAPAAPPITVPPPAGLPGQHTVCFLFLIYAQCVILTYCGSSHAGMPPGMPPGMPLPPKFRALAAQMAAAPPVAPTTTLDAPAAPEAPTRNTVVVDLRQSIAEAADKAAAAKQAQAAEQAAIANMSSTIAAEAKARRMQGKAASEESSSDDDADEWATLRQRLKAGKAPTKQVRIHAHPLLP